MFEGLFFRIRKYENSARLEFLPLQNADKRKNMNCGAHANDSAEYRIGHKFKPAANQPCAKNQGSDYAEQPSGADLSFHPDDPPSE